MTRQSIHLLTDYQGSYRQALYDYQGINLDRFRTSLGEYGIRTETTRFSDLVNRDAIGSLAGTRVLYTSSGRLPYKRFLDDVLFELSREATLIPGYDLFRAHENKGYQELLRIRHRLPGPQGWYFGSLEEVRDLLPSLPMPCVVKLPHGAGSSRVFKCDTPEELERRVSHMLHQRIWHAKQFLRANVVRKPDPDAIRRESSHLGQVVVQEFVPGLTHDWKVLVYGSRLFCLKRGVRDNDFRASGSGKFEFVDPPDRLLDAAASIARTLDTPFLSLDLVLLEDGPRLIEFQAVHFGPTTLLEAPCAYERSSDGWHRVPGRYTIEEESARAVHEYIEGIDVGAE